VARHPLPARRPAFEPFPRSALDRSIPARFEQEADRAPDRSAVTIDGVAWSYGTLGAAANRVAHALLRRSATGCPVALLIEPGLHLAAAILGALKAGAIYVPLEAWHTPAHVAEIVAEAGAETILAGAAGTALAAAAARKTTCLAIPEILAGGGDAARPGVAVPSSAHAYVYYTSGTTGRPKGVVDTHANVLHNVMRYTNTLGVDRVGVHDRFLDLGGESLALGRVHARLQALLGREVSIVSLFDLATVEAVAAHLERGDHAGVPRALAPRRRKPGARRAGGAVYTGAVDGPPRAVRKEDPMAVGEAPIKQAITWIDEQLQANPGANRARLVDEAGRRFDLTPLDADFLARHLAERKAP
jgi:hypothetical protein